MIASLPELIAPLSEQDFIGILRNRTLTLQRGADADRFRPLLDWKTLRGLIEGGTIPPAKFRMTCNTHDVAEIFYTQDGKVDALKFAALIERGASVLTKPLEKHVPALKTLCADISVRLSEPVKADAIVTTGGGGALKAHYDFPDLIVMQMEGSKRWRCYGPPVNDPIVGMPPLPGPPGPPMFDEVLRAGDILFLPRGYWHHCDNGPGVSLHVAIMIFPQTGWHAMNALLSRLMSDELLRVPLTRFDDEAARAAHESAVKARLVEMIDRASLAELVARGRPARIDGNGDRSRD